MPISDPAATLTATGDDRGRVAAHLDGIRLIVMAICERRSSPDSWRLACPLGSVRVMHRIPSSEFARHAYEGQELACKLGGALRVQTGRRHHHMEDIIPAIEKSACGKVPNDLIIEIPLAAKFGEAVFEHRRKRGANHVIRAASPLGRQAKRRFEESQD